MAPTNEVLLPLLVYSTSKNVYRFCFTTEEMRRKVNENLNLAEILVRRAVTDHFPPVGTYEEDEEGRMIISWTNLSARVGFEHLPCLPIEGNCTDDVSSNCIGNVDIPSDAPGSSVLTQNLSPEVEASSGGGQESLKDLHSPARKKMAFSTSPSTSDLAVVIQMKKLTPFKGENIENECVGKVHQEQDLFPFLKTHSRKPKPTAAKGLFTTATVGDEILKINSNSLKKVVVENLPEKFFKDHFIDFLNTEVCKLLGLDEEEMAIRNCSDKDPSQNSVVVEFRTVDEAGAACLLEHLSYGGKELVLTQQCMNSGEEKTARVKVENLPKKFFKDHFIDFLNTEVCRLLGLDEEEMAIRNCSDKDPSQNSIFVEFRTVDEAGTACLLEHLNYGGKELVLTQQCMNSGEEKTARVKVENLPKKFFKDHFIDFLNTEVCKLLGLDEEEMAIRNCSDKDPSQNFVVVEFRTVDEAGTACLLEHLNYGGRELVLAHQCESRSDATHELIAQMSHNEDGAVPISDEETIEDVGGDSNSVLFQNETRKTGLDTLESDYAQIAFITLLTKHKSERKHAKWDTLYDLVIGDLEEEYGVATDIEHCRRRKKCLDDLYRKQKKKYGGSKIQWPFFCAMGKLRGDDIHCVTAGHSSETCPGQQLMSSRAQKSTVHRSINVPSGAKPDKMTFFSKGSFFTVQATRTLISTIIEHDFDTLKRNSAVWDDVKASMDKKGLNFEKKKLIRHFQELTDKYKNYKSSLSKTGQGRVDWEYYEDMSRLMDGNVAVDALLTAAVGASQEMRARKDCCLSETGRQAKTRPPSNPRNVSASKEGSRVTWKDNISQCLSKLVSHLVEQKADQ